MPLLRPLSARPSFALALALAATLATGCIVQLPAGTDLTKPLATPGTTASPKAKASPAAPPRPGDATTFNKFKEGGRVQVTFKGLGKQPAALAGKPGMPKTAAGVVGQAGGNLVAAGAGNLVNNPRFGPLLNMNGLQPGHRKLFATTDDIDHVQVTLTSDKGGEPEVQDIDRETLLLAYTSLFFDHVPTGNGHLQVVAYSAAGTPIGSGSQDFKVEANKLTDVPVSVRLMATGSVGATISFEEPEIEAVSLAGEWLVSSGTEPPDGPVVACNQEYVWSITQIDGYVRGTASGYNPPDAADHPGMSWYEEAIGQFDADTNELHLRGQVQYSNENGEAAPSEQSDYRLTFDPVSHHLRGTRNGKPGWGAPVTYDESCFGPSAPPTVGPWEPQPFQSDQPTPVGPPTRITGRVWAADDKPLSGFVYLYSDDSDYSQEVAIAPDGTYRFDGVPSFVSYTLYAYDDNGNYTDNAPIFTFDDQEGNTLDLQLLATDYGNDPTPVSSAYPWTPSPAWCPGPNWTPGPSYTPTYSPTYYPTAYPTAYPSYYPTAYPSYFPTAYPSYYPTAYPSNYQTPVPTNLSSPSPKPSGK